ncbi:MAG: hypothetical protein LBB23_04120 [Rickettsiales bacterium]|nr:hypothetical protein [Rickettsiales bacterium]
MLIAHPGTSCHPSRGGESLETRRNLHTHTHTMKIAKIFLAVVLCGAVSPVRADNVFDLDKFNAVNAEKSSEQKAIETCFSEKVVQSEEYRKLNKDGQDQLADKKCADEIKAYNDWKAKQPAATGAIPTSELILITPKNKCQEEYEQLRVSPSCTKKTNSNDQKCCVAKSKYDAIVKGFGKECEVYNTDYKVEFFPLGEKFEGFICERTKENINQWVSESDINSIKPCNRDTYDAVRTKFLDPNLNIEDYIKACDHCKTKQSFEAAMQYNPNINSPEEASEGCKALRENEENKKLEDKCGNSLLAEINSKFERLGVDNKIQLCEACGKDNVKNFNDSYEFYRSNRLRNPGWDDIREACNDKDREMGHERVADEVNGEKGKEVEAEDKQTTEAETKVSDKLADLSAFQLDKASWLKKTDGETNWKRLGWDAGAAVALGAVGGFLTNHLVKAKQVDKGFEAVQCSVAGFAVAGFGDQVSVGKR